MPDDDAQPHHPWSFVLERYRLAYVTVPKAACTTMKWLVAELSGESIDGADTAMHAAASRRQLIHQRKLWRHTPSIGDFQPEHRATMTRDAGWLAFTVVRDPRVRLWSAWQSKLLLRMASYVARYADAPWFPRVPTEPAHVIDDFATFVRAYEEGGLGALRYDGHFRPQAEVLRAVGVPDLATYDLARMRELIGDLETHLRPHGRALPELTRDNPSPLPLIDAVLADGVQESIERSFAADCEQWGGQWPQRPPTRPSSTWSEGAFDDVAVRVEMHERLGDLAALVRRRARGG